MLLTAEFHRSHLCGCHPSEYACSQCETTSFNMCGPRRIITKTVFLTIGKRIKKQLFQVRKIYKAAYHEDNDR